jgi:hypothetical protein
MNGRAKQSTGAGLSNEWASLLNAIAEMLQLATLLICQAKSANATQASPLTKIMAEDR